MRRSTPTTPIPTFHHPSAKPSETAYRKSPRLTLQNTSAHPHHHGHPSAPPLTGPSPIHPPTYLHPPCKPLPSLLQPPKNGPIHRPPPPPARIPRPYQQPARGHHGGARVRRRPAALGGADPGARGHAVRGRHLPGRAALPQGLPAGAAEHEVPGGDLASEWYVTVYIHAPFFA